MARPIPLTIPARDPRAELKQRLDLAPQDHAAALLSAFEVLQGMHDRGVLEILRGAMGSSDRVMEIAVDFAKSPQSIRSIRNLVILVNLIGTIEPEQVKNLTQATPKILNEAGASQPPGFLKLAWTAFWSKDLRRGLWMGMSLLEAFGREQHSKNAKAA